MKTNLFFFLMLQIGITSTACVNHEPYVPRDTIKPETVTTRLLPPPPPMPKVESVFKSVPEMPRFPGAEDVFDKVERDSCAKEKR